MLRFRPGLVFPWIFALLAGALRAWGADAGVSFDRHIKPILAARCLKCHGEAMQLARLDLRTREAALKGGERGGPSIHPGQATLSPLYRRVAGLDKPVMPMDGKLAPEEVERIRSWIEQGAPWATPIASEGKSPEPVQEPGIPPEARDHWAFRKPVRPAVPAGAKHPVDAFLAVERQRRNLSVAPPADRLTLLRRAYLDLIGIPPTGEETQAFLNDESPQAWENLIERLLASPHYGERWGRHWLDVARYADSNGYEHDFDRPNAWRYRDYVIRSFNRDTPYNVFLLEQIAGDELDWVTHDTLIATGFLRNYAKVGFREKDNPQFRYDYLDDMIATIGRGVLGMTPQCARCHDHKFDPIPQRDYYRLQASLFGYVEVDHPLVEPGQAAAWKRANEAVEAKLAPLQQQVRALEKPFREQLLQAKYKRYPRHIQEAIETPEDKRTPGQMLLANQVIRTTNVSGAEIDGALPPDLLAEKRRLQDEMKRIEAERPKPIPMAMGITDGDYRFAPDGPGDEPAPGKGVKREATEGSYLHEGPGRYHPPPSYFLHHGDIESRGPLMKPGFLTVVTFGEPPVELPPASGKTSGRRRALAEWLGSADNPLTARVIVNRIWHHHFGRGIVASIDNFGKTGDPPTHPQLLDWLALEFQQRGWSVKQMHRLMMTSEAYRMSSGWHHEDNLARDADNTWLWRFRPQRLEAEVVRDSILSVAGSLNRQMFGPPVFPRLAPEVLRNMKHGIWRQQEEGPQTWRRSVYVYRKRGLPFPFFEVFDLPDQNLTCGRRNISTVPTQALALLNSEFLLEQSRRFARRIRQMAGAGAAEQVDLAYRLALTRPPLEAERKLAIEFLEHNTLEDLAHVVLNLNEFVYLR